MFGGIDMLRYFLVLSLALPLSGYCQTYADSPFYQPVSAIPPMARVDGYAHGSIHANGVVIDLSEWTPESSPDFDRIAGWSAAADVDGRPPTQIFHFYTQYDGMNPVVLFGYDLRTEPVSGTDEIKCTFSALTDPTGWPSFHPNKEVRPVALPADLTPVVVHSGDVLAIRTLPLGSGRIAAVHYLRLTRTDRMPSSDR
jgi:hypothetical protein